MVYLEYQKLASFTDILNITTFQAGLILLICWSIASFTTDSKPVVHSRYQRFRKLCDMIDVGEIQTFENLILVQIYRLHEVCSVSYM